MLINQRYEIIKKLGEGRSKVFLCKDTDTSKLVAMKVLENVKDNLEVKTFKDEYRTLNKLSHPNIIKCFDSGTFLEIEEEGINNKLKKGSLYFTLEYFNGVPIFDFPEVRKEINLLLIIKQIASALFYLHQSNYIFGDIKSENILVSQTSRGPEVRLIDFGFTHIFSPTDEFETVGTAEYLAPEILKSEICDHRIDIYALGILLYKIVYQRFPFEQTSEIDIFKAHIENEFSFPQTNVSVRIIAALKKLLEKNPLDRYLSTLQLLLDLRIPLTKELKTEWVPVNRFSEKVDAISASELYIKDKTKGDLLVLRGGDNSGKSEILEELEQTNEDAILFKASEVQSELTYWKVLLKKILFCPAVFQGLRKETIIEVKETIKKDKLDITAAMRSLFAKLLTDKKLILLFDGYNEYSSFNFELIKQIVVLAQINKVKVILTESTLNYFYSDELKNIVVFDLVHYSPNDLEEMINYNFPVFFPKKEIISLVLNYAERTPAGLMNFFRELISEEILDFNLDGPYITTKTDKINYLKNNRHNRILNQIKSLNDDQLLLVQSLSALNVEVSLQTLFKLLDKTPDVVENHIRELNEKNIVQLSKTNESLNFPDSETQSICLATIEKKEEFYLQLAEKIQEFKLNIGKSEVARLFEVAKEFSKSYELYKEELETADSINALQYQRNIIIRLLKFPLLNSELVNYQIQLAEILLKLSENKRALNLSNLIIQSEVDADQKLRALILKGTALIRMGEPKQGKDILNSALEKLSDGSEIVRVMLEIADAEFDLSNFDECTNICEKVITDKNSSTESLGKAHNILGMIKFFSENNLDAAIIKFERALELFKESKLPIRYAGTKVNLGNIFFLKGDQSKAEKNWSEALNINRDIGNLDQEAKLLLSYGIYFFEKLQFDQAIEYQKRAQNIFSSFGDKNGLGLVLANLGEIFMETCDYQDAYDVLEEANFIFKQLSNIEEEAQVTFMLGKLFFTLGHIPKLLNCIKYYQRIIENNKLSEKHSLNLSFLKNLALLYQNNIFDNKNGFIDIRDQFLYFEDRPNYIYSGIIIIETLIKSEKFQEALNELKDESFENICGENKFFQAYLYYLYGDLAQNWNNKTLEPAIEYYQKSYKIISEEHISELSWKIVSSIAVNYVSRGNYKKASEYIYSAKYLIEMIAENIKDVELKEAYLNEKQRMATLEKLQNFEKKL